MFRGSKPTVLNFDVTASSFNSIFFGTYFSVVFELIQSAFQLLSS
jgi:hypothetical protein